MTRRRWIADETSGNRAALVGAHADHLVRVLRVRTGQEFDIACGSEVRRGRVCAIEDGRVEFELGEEVVPTVAGLALTLALAVFKFDRMEWAIEKCTELGVERIVPVIAQRSDAHLAAAAGKRVERWQRIAREAAEQSRRDAPPQIASPVKVKEAVVLPVQRESCLRNLRRKGDSRRWWPTIPRERALFSPLDQRVAGRRRNGSSLGKRAGLPLQWGEQSCERRRPPSLPW